MNNELSKAFEKVIDFYNTDLDSREIIGTEMYEKMSSLEERVLKFRGLDVEPDGTIYIYDKSIHRCSLCGIYFLHGDTNDELYFSEQAVNCRPSEKILRLMFPDEKEYNRIVGFNDANDCWNFCHDCSERYRYNALDNSFEGESSDSEEL